ncbi:MgtC/SapB family protein [Geobacter pickeringii]|uniref:Magnesium transporter MgtC n=1 Tax=Geobacter pickeringii TaxID=345632 RepID=A0A0B5BG08_9BACT|nr:MgtC/SapB family protein [Geobacter pickeringii]AJE03455.1 magnesium transporter MgtC [Geobacter pickeringii]
MDFNVEILIRLVLASFLGGFIGLEREVHGRPAGFRTHLLVSLGSCLFVASSLEFYRLYGNFSGSGPVGVDPARIAAQVVAGIGFLGAGAIIREGASIRGLTTAACLWIAAAIGLACGVGLYMVSVAVTSISLATLLLLKKVEGALKRDKYSTIKVWSDDLEGQMDRIKVVLDGCRLELVDVGMEKDVDTSKMYFEFEVRFSSGDLACRVVDDVASVTGVRRVRLE